MAILGKTSITELNLITPLSNANLENSKITINGTAVPLGGSYTYTYTPPTATTSAYGVIKIDSATTSNLLYTLGQGDSNPSDNTWYITSVSTGTGTTFYKRSHSYLYGYLKEKFDSVYQPKGNYLTTSGTAADSNKLGGVAASGYALKTDLSGYLTTGGTAAAANKVVSALTLTYGSTAGKTGSTTYSGNTSPTVYIPTSTSHITNDSGYITSAHTHAASAITGGTNGYFLKADSNGKGVWTSVTIPSAYSLPTANRLVKGGVKVGDFLLMSGETLYVKTGTTNATVAVGNHTHSTYATKDEIAAINQTIEENELVTAEALININDRITNIVNTESSSEKAYLTGLAESGEGEIVMNNDVYMAGGNIYVQDGKIVATQEYLDENLETLAAAAVDLNNRLNNGAPVKVEKSENVRAELGGFVVRNWNNEVPEIHTSHYVSSGVYMEQNSVYTVNGFYQTSDERKKNFENEIEVDFNKLKEIPKSYFTWKDDEKQVRNIGTSAQKLAEIYPELVSYNETDDEYSVSYAELSIVALKAVDKLYEENQMLREELAMIKKHLGL